MTITKVLDGEVHLDMYDDRIAVALPGWYRIKK